MVLSEERGMGKPVFPVAVASLAFLACLTVGVEAIHAGPGELDTSFGVGGVVQTPFPVFAMAVQPDNRILVAGGHGSGPDGLGNFRLARYNSDGTVDATFGTGGQVTTDFGPNSDDQVWTLIVQPDGKILAAGSVLACEAIPGTLLGRNDFAVVRYNVDGSLDPGFGVGGVVVGDPVELACASRQQRARALILQPDSKIVVTGINGDVDGVGFVARLNPDGTRDTSFGSSGLIITKSADTISPEWRTVGRQADGKLILGGQSSGVFFALARFDSDGKLDSTFGSGGIVQTSFGQGAIGALNQGSIAALEIAADGRIMAVGRVLEFLAGGPTERFALVRYTPDGSVDPSFGAAGIVTTDFTALVLDCGSGGMGPNAFATAVARQADGGLVVAGARGEFGEALAMARYQQNGTLDSLFGTSGRVVGCVGFPTSLAIQVDGKLLVGGNGVARYGGGPPPPPPPSPRSDRLRDQHAQASSSQVPERSSLTADTPTPARSPEPTTTQEQSLPQQPPRPSEAPPPQRSNEPDPRDVIDWLLKR